jgi:hypothetical protein
MNANKLIINITIKVLISMAIWITMATANIEVYEKNQ